MAANNSSSADASADGPRNSVWFIAQNLVSSSLDDFAPGFAFAYTELSQIVSFLEISAIEIHEVSPVTMPRYPAQAIANCASEGCGRRGHPHARS